MSVTRENDEVIWECDGCGALLHTYLTNFDAARTKLNNSEWSVRHMLGSWEHFCPKCKKRPHHG
jgi:ribosomal protein L37AE/L43A